MKYKFFCIPARTPDVVTEEMNSFIAGKRVADIERQLISNGDRSYWSVCVSFVESEKTTSSSKQKVDYRDILSAQDFAVYSKIRDLRKKISGQENVPLYALFTNDQLAEMVQKKVQTMPQLATVTGVGTTRLNKYGNRFLSVLKEEFSKRPTPQPGNRKP